MDKTTPVEMHRGNGGKTF